MPATAAELRGRQRGDQIFDTVWTLALAVTVVWTGQRLMQSAAWQRVLEFVPGGWTTVMAIIVSAAAGMVVAVFIWDDPPLGWVPFFVVSAWCLAVVIAQLWSAFADPTGPLGWFAWFYCCWHILKHGFAMLGRFR